jgi:hypothetical protein
MGLGMAPPTPPPAAPAAPPASREEEVVTLGQMAGDLRKQLAEVMDRIDRLEKGG